MIRNVRVENYKSIVDLSVDLGRVTVLIGANGSGKSNILEAIALASATAQNKLDNEFLISRGVRVCETRFMRSAFGEPSATPEIKLSVQGDEGVSYRCSMATDENSSFPKWSAKTNLGIGEFFKFLEESNWPGKGFFDQEKWDEYELKKSGRLARFLIYAPENSALRTFQTEGQILPLGIRGEGLFAHLKALNSETHRDRLAKIKERLTASGVTGVRG